jgi:hypothetical protein
MIEQINVYTIHIFMCKYKYSYIYIYKYIDINEYICLYIYIYIYAHTAWPVARKVNSCCVAFVLCPNLADIDLWSPAIQENRHQDNRKIL